MNPLALVNLAALMEITSGRPEIVIGLIDGPVATSHPDLAEATIRVIPGELSGACARASGAACMHGTFVAGILCARRGSVAPAICPGCTLLLRPIFAESPSAGAPVPGATPEELAAAIVDCVERGARVINLSAALVEPSAKGAREVDQALDYALGRRILVVAAAGNQGTVGSSAITRHSWVIPVIGCDAGGRPLNQSNLGSSIGRRGLMAPGKNIASLGAGGRPITSEGTSVAAPFVTGAIALLWSEFLGAAADQIKRAVVPMAAPRRATIVPSMLDAAAAYRAMRLFHRMPATV